MPSNAGGGTIDDALGRSTLSNEGVGSGTSNSEDGHAADDDLIEDAVERVAAAAGRFRIDEDDEDLDDGEAGNTASSDTRSVGLRTGDGAAYLLSSGSSQHARSNVLASGISASATPANGPTTSSTLPKPIGPASRDAPVCCIVIGMAGSGKTTLMQRLNAETHMAGQPAYIMNLDPAVTHLPYGPNIDVRDTVNYKEVMKQYGLGPNGAIVTSLNLFATRFDQVLTLLEARTPTLKYVMRKWNMALVVDRTAHWSRTVIESYR